MQYYTDIEYMFIDGQKIVLTSVSYQFQEEGDHIVNIQFKNLGTYKSALFKNNKNIKSVNFTDFNEYFISFSFELMFENCINLYSVDFSQISYNFHSNADYMFNGCTNLKFVNIKNIQLHETSDYMFANCKSLISIDLSNLDFSNVKFLRNMFENCFSLQTVNLKNSNLYSAEDINNMFLNCYSLKELDFLLLNPKI